MIKTNSDVVIIGGGMVGLTVAHQLIEQSITRKITLIDQEPELGLHSSGRNSGVLHAGLYYKADSLKAKVCVNGARRLKAWIKEKGLQINSCGKVIVPTKGNLDSQLDVLAERGRANGASVFFLNEKELYNLSPEARTASGRALWSPDTAVVNPLEIVQKLQLDLQNKGVEILRCKKNLIANPKSREIIFSDGTSVNYSHLFNCAGLQADKIAHQFGVGLNYNLMPFKGMYWQLKENCPIKPKINLYPVPDLNVPFLGIHFTPNVDPKKLALIGPTATPAWGRENYRRGEGIEPSMSITNLAILLHQYMANRGNFRRYVHEQAFLIFSPFLLKAAQELIPTLKIEHIEPSEKVGIRSQLFNQKTKALEDDFLCLPGLNSTHVLNSISPAFTASFSLADLIIQNSELTRQTK